MDLQKKEIKLGISLYPSKAEVEELTRYIDLASSRYFRYLFLNMIGAEEKKAHERNMYICRYASKRGFDVSLDISVNQIMKRSPTELVDLLNNLTKEGVFAIRVDDGLDGKAEEFILTHNDKLSVELNASTNSASFDYLYKNAQAYRERIIASHNFYPQEDTGLSEEFFLQATQRCLNYGIKDIGSFITLNKSDNLKGVWAEGNITPTLESHRKLPLVTQLQHLLMFKDIKRALISNQFASKKDLENLSKLRFRQLSLFVKLEDHITPFEKKIILEDKHHVRGDMSVGFIRSTQNRIVLKDHSIPVNNAISNGFYDVGDILLINESFGRYKGELQVVLQPGIKRTSKKNIIAKVIPSNLFLLKLAQPWMPIGFFAN